MRLIHTGDLSADGRVAYLLVRVEADIDTKVERNPVNLALVIDRSSSMRGPRIAQAVSAASQVVDKLDGRDRLTVVVFDAGARTVFGPAPVTDDIKPRLLDAISQIKTGVGTNLAAGIKKGADAIKTGYVRGAIARLVLLTDGQPSVGLTDGDRLCNIVEQQFEHGVTTTTMGIGEGFEDELLAEMARRGRGGFHYLAMAENIAAAFGHELAGVFSIAAQKVALKLVPHTDVSSVELLHRLPSRPLDDGLSIEIGEVAAGAPRQALFKLGLGESKRLGTLTCTYKKPDGTAGDPHIVGLELKDPVPPEDAREVTTERLFIECATAVDVAWARRASGESVHALEALAEVKEDIDRERARDRIREQDAQALFEDMAAAEQAIAKSAAEREKIRRGLKERSQITLLGRSVIRRLPTRDDE